MRRSSKKIILFASCALLLSSLAASVVNSATANPKARKPAQQCQAVKWPFATSEKNFTPQALGQVERSNLYAYLYFELGAVKSSRTPKLAEGLFFYLINTETNEPKAKLLEGIQSVADLNSQTPNIVSIEELCNYESRLPNSARIYGKKK
ncbi:MAG: hypothetical protein J0L82_18180 [Deltaproteobacteria bacterium]|nr:hypothetical protein [Deltaproteobacteria bacterium]